MKNEESPQQKPGKKLFGSLDHVRHGYRPKTNQRHLQWDIDRDESWFFKSRITQKTL